MYRQVGQLTPSMGTCNATRMLSTEPRGSHTCTYAKLAAIQMWCQPLNLLRGSVSQKHRAYTQDDSVGGGNVHTQLTVGPDSRLIAGSNAHVAVTNAKFAHRPCKGMLRLLQGGRAESILAVNT